MRVYEIVILYCTLLDLILIGRFSYKQEHEDAQIQAAIDKSLAVNILYDSRLIIGIDFLNIISLSDIPINDSPFLSNLFLISRVILFFSNTTIKSIGRYTITNKTYNN